MLDMLRLVSSEDVGHDEASVQSLVKKHKVGRRFYLFVCFLSGFPHILEFKKGIFQAWKVMDIDCGHGSHGIPPIGHGIF